MEKMLNIDYYYRNESEKKNNISPHYCQDDSHQKVSVSQPGNIFILLLHPPRIMHYHGYVYISSGSDGKIICLQCWRPRFNPWVGKTPWRRKWQPTPVLLPGKFHGCRNLIGYSPWGHKESDMTEQLHFHFSYCICVSLHAIFIGKCINAGNIVLYSFLKSAYNCIIVYVLCNFVHSTLF